MTTVEAALDPNSCWLAVIARDASAEGKFYFGVLTTGVFCRPGCAARLPKRENVRFYATADAAGRDGLRPCRRCRPLEPSMAPMLELCGYIEAHSDSSLTLSDLARRAGLTPSHLQRRFKAAIGVSPKRFLDACRLRNFKTHVRTGTGVTAAIYDAGFGSLSRLYEKARPRLGMTPMEYRSGGRGVAIQYRFVDTKLGRILVGLTNLGICFSQFGDADAELMRELEAEYPNASIVPMPELAPEPAGTWLKTLSAQIDGAPPGPDLPVHVRATVFQQRVWTHLQSIPPATVQSYSQVAAAIGQPSAARAVASACAANPVAVAIPCHRVTRGTGALGGYRWGGERKRALLDRERRPVESQPPPGGAHVNRPAES